MVGALATPSFTQAYRLIHSYTYIVLYVLQYDIYDILWNKGMIHTLYSEIITKTFLENDI